MNFWPFSKRYSLSQSGVLQGFCDMHAHILPGVDDGVQSMDEALEILTLYEQLGIRKVYLTPHIMEDIPNAVSQLKETFIGLKSAWKGSVELYLSAENMLDNLFYKHLEENDLLPFGEERNQLLVETFYFNPPQHLYGLLEQIKSKGYFPVLAHPERYVYMSDGDYHKLKEMGILFQLNLFSLLGAYGKFAKVTAHQLLSEGLYNFCATDIHNIDSFSHYIHVADLTKKELNQIHSVFL
ncbi:MAG TPA: capsular biosynthesis protein [Paludibacteraceae bacterium]|nr:capsular biosynthesis protein [Paludibacteraceae bacterium]HQF51168.1 capsular biosynthesis protein [Paludibacteraceae bacterium]